MRSLKKNRFLLLSAVLILIPVLGCARSAKVPSAPVVLPPVPWVSAVNQIGLAAFQSELEAKGLFNSVIAPFETLQLLLEKEGGENPSRQEVIENIQDSILLAKDHAVELKTQTERGFRSFELKGEWAEKFHFKKHKKSPFQTFTGPKSIPMMQAMVYEAYLHTEGFQAVRLRFGDGKVALYLFLPDETTDFVQFVKKVSETKLNFWFPQFLERQGEIIMPRFRVAYEPDLAKIGESLGLTFDFTDIKTGAVFTADEKGSEEASLPYTEVIGPEKFQMTVNRPFFFIVRDNETGILLLLGTVADPQAKS